MINRKCLALLLVVSLCSFGCAPRVKTVTNLPTNVTQAQAQNWDAAVANLHKVAVTVSSLRQSVSALHQQGILKDGPEYVTILEGIGKVDQVQIAASNFLKQSPSNFSDTTKGQVKDYMQQISAAIASMNSSGITGIKDPTSQQQVTQLLGEITTAVSLILSL